MGMMDNNLLWALLLSVAGIFSIGAVIILFSKLEWWFVIYGIIIGALSVGLAIRRFVLFLKEDTEVHHGG